MPKYSVYVLIKDDKPVYVGVSSRLYNRSIQHTKQGKDFDRYYAIYETRDKKEAYVVENVLIKFLTIFHKGIYNSSQLLELYHFHHGQIPENTNEL